MRYIVQLRGRCPIVFLATLLIGPISAAAVDCSQANLSQNVSSGDLLNISGVGFSDANTATAIGYWDDCAGYGIGFPAMMVGGTGGIPITVQYIDGPSTNNRGSCGRFTPTINGQTGEVIGGVIEIWREEAGGTACNGSDTLAHELGHVLGLADATDSACVGHIMGGRPEGGTRTVYSDDCDIARARWITTDDRELTEDDGGGPCAV